MLPLRSLMSAQLTSFLRRTKTPGVPWYVPMASTTWSPCWNTVSRSLSPHHVRLSSFVLFVSTASEARAESSACACFLAWTFPAWPEAKAIHRCPASSRNWSGGPNLSAPRPKRNPRKKLVFSFYNGELFQIAVNYDRYKTAGLTVDDFIEALSATYGVAEKPAPPGNAIQGEFGAQDEIVARWQDSQYSFDLTRSSYGPSRFVKRLCRWRFPNPSQFLQTN
jgi:hypothetical protein